MSEVPVLLIGSFHMGNPGADIVNLEADDMLAPHRQQEIESVVAGLSRFEPTKVLVEHPRDDISLLERYRNFRIAANVHSTAEHHDRLVIIYGAGHIPVLEHALAFSPRFKLFDALDYLAPS